jgi:demethylmenaquinone methyltransferase/2-methoxy-6-polyprenyl-1,4-benzoquinol methylase
MKRGIRRIFSEVAQTYELVNHLLTWGLDRHWRKKAAGLAARALQGLWLDVCSGTGEMALDLAAVAGAATMVVSLDFAPRMLEKAAGKTSGQRIHPVLADALLLPFADGTFDLVTISFGTRNINLSRTVLTRHFEEFRRVLKPGGRFVNLETSQPPRRLIRGLFHLYVRLAVRPIGYFVSGSRQGYVYLSRTIPRFYEPETLGRILSEAGFTEIGYERLLFGAVAIHVAKRHLNPLLGEEGSRPNGRPRAS